MLGRPGFFGSDFQLSPDIDGGIRNATLGCSGISAYSFDQHIPPEGKQDVLRHAAFKVISFLT